MGHPQWECGTTRPWEKASVPAAHRTKRGVAWAEESVVVTVCERLGEEVGRQAFEQIRKQPCLRVASVLVPHTTCVPSQ